MTSFVYTAEHTIHYSTKNPLTILEVIDALKSLEQLLHGVPGVVTGITGIDIAKSEFLIENVQSGSLTETILVKLFFKDEAEFGQFLDKIRENGMLRNTIVGAALGGLIAYGIALAVSTNKTQAPNITANNNTIINIGAGEVKLTPEAFQAIVESAVKDKKEHAKAAVNFIAPAKSDPSSAVTISGHNMPEIEFTKEAIAETPEKVVIPANQKIDEYHAKEIIVRATNLDSKKSGWAGKIEGLTNRVVIELDPTIDESIVFGKSKIKADVTIISSLPKGHSEYTPTKIVIRKVYQN